MDNFFSNVPLFESLKSKETEVCSTVRACRKGLPTDFSIINLRRGDDPVIYVHEHTNLLAYTQKNSGKINMLSSVGNEEIKGFTIKSKKGSRQVNKPSVQIAYTWVVQTYLITHPTLSKEDIGSGISAYGISLQKLPQ